MSKKSNTKDNIIAGLVFLTGAVIGGAITAIAMANKPKKPAIVLEKAKEEFKDFGNIVGSWIDYDITIDTNYQSQPEVYIGGISVENDGAVSHFEFIADVYTGHIIDMRELNRA